MKHKRVRDSSPDDSEAAYDPLADLRAVSAASGSDEDEESLATDDSLCVASSPAAEPKPKKQRTETAGSGGVAQAKAAGPAKAARPGTGQARAAKGKGTGTAAHKTAGAPQPTQAARGQVRAKPGAAKGVERAMEGLRSELREFMASVQDGLASLGGSRAGSGVPGQGRSSKGTRSTTGSGHGSVDFSALQTKAVKNVVRSVVQRQLWRKDAESRFDFDCDHMKPLVMAALEEQLEDLGLDEVTFEEQFDKYFGYYGANGEKMGGWQLCTHLRTDHVGQRAKSAFKAFFRHHDTRPVDDRKKKSDTPEQREERAATFNAFATRCGEILDGGQWRDVSKLFDAPGYLAGLAAFAQPSALDQLTGHVTGRVCVTFLQLCAYDYKIELRLRKPSIASRGVGGTIEEVTGHVSTLRDELRDALKGGRTLADVAPGIELVGFEQAAVPRARTAATEAAREAGGASQDAAQQLEGEEDQAPPPQQQQQQQSEGEDTLPLRRTRSRKPTAGSGAAPSLPSNVPTTVTAATVQLPKDLVRALDTKLSDSVKFRPIDGSLDQSLKISKAMLGYVEDGELLSDDLLALVSRRMYFNLLDDHQRISRLRIIETPLWLLQDFTAVHTLFQSDYVVFIHHNSVHWSLHIVCHVPCLLDSNGRRGATPCILVADSCYGMHDHEKLGQDVRNALADEHLRRGGSDEAAQQLRSPEALPVRLLDVPQQQDGHSCGDFALCFMYHFIRSMPVAITARLLRATGQGRPQRYTCDGLGLAMFHTQQPLMLRRLLRTCLWSLVGAQIEGAVPKPLAAKVKAEEEGYRRAAHKAPPDAQVPSALEELFVVE